MSESKASVIPVVPPQFAVNASSQILVDVPSENVRYIAATATTGVNTSKVNFTVDVPPNTLLQSNVSIRFPCEFKIAGDLVDSGGAAQHVMPEFKSGFSKNSIFNMITNQSITINQQNMSVKPSEIVHALTDYLPFNRSNNELTAWQNYPDIAPTFKELLASADSSALNSPFVGNELSQWGKRNIHDWEDVSTRTRTNFHVRGTITIPIVGVAAFSALGLAKPLAHVNRLQVSLDLSPSEAYKCINREELQDAKVGNDTYSVEMSFYQAPELLYCTVEPPAMMRPLLYHSDGTAIPQDYNHNLLNHAYSSSGFTEIKDQETKDLYATHSLATTPSALYIWAERGVANGKAMPMGWTESPECYGLIESLEVDINNKRHVFDTADVLYKISAKNGLSFPRAVAIKAGFVVKLDLSVDASMGSFFTGSSAKSTLAIKARVKNTRKFQLGAAPNGSVPFQLHLIAVDKGLLRIVDSSNVRIFSTLITDDVKEQLISKTSSPEAATAMAPVHLAGSLRLVDGGNSDGFTTGGAWWDSIWSGIKKVANVVSPIAQTVSSVASKVGDVSKMISAAGRGGYKAGTTNLQQMV